MSQIYCYGEDALTYWAITSQLDKILRPLEDDCSPDEAIIVYRPSFGRRGRANLNSAGKPLRAGFGECDAIIGTRHSTYLIESKWSSSPKVQGNKIILNEVQIHRHEIIRWYLDKWRASQPMSWQTFISEFECEFIAKFQGNKMAPFESILAKNLEFLLKTLSQCGTCIQNILLFFDKAGGTKPMEVSPASFHLVTLEYYPLAPSGYFQIFPVTG